MTTGWQEVSKSSWCIIVKLWETNLDSEAGLIVRFSADEIYKIAAFLSLFPVIYSVLSTQIKFKVLHLKLSFNLHKLIF